MNLKELEKLIDSGQHGVPFDLRIDNDELSLFANDKTGSLASDVSVRITPQSVAVEAKAKFAALTMNVRVVGKPALEDGQLRFDIDSMEINNKPAPDFMRAQIHNALNEKLQPSEVPVTVSRLQLGDGWVEVEGATK